MAASWTIEHLPDDSLECVGFALADPLTPRLAVALSSASRALRRQLAAPLAGLKTGHDAARELCAHTRASRGTLGEVAQLDWDRMDLGAAHMRTLGLLCHSLPRLQSLFLCGNMIGSGGVESMMGGAGRHALPALTFLNLSSNGIGPQGGVALAAALRRGALPVLGYLQLSDNPLGDSGLAPLVACGTLPPTLTHLFPYAAEIGDAGVAALLANARLCRALKTLNLRSNRISDAGCAALASAIDGGGLPALAQLFVDSNPSSSPAARRAVDEARSRACERAASAASAAGGERGLFEPQFSNSLSFV